MNGKTVAPINNTNKISKGIPGVIFSRRIRGTVHCGEESHATFVAMGDLSKMFMGSTLSNRFLRESASP